MMPLPISLLLAYLTELVIPLAAIAALLFWLNRLRRMWGEARRLAGGTDRLRLERRRSKGQPNAAIAGR